MSLISPHQQDTGRFQSVCLNICLSSNADTLQAAIKYFGGTRYLWDNNHVCGFNHFLRMSKLITYGPSTGNLAKVWV